MRDIYDPARYRECAEVLDEEGGKTLESFCRLTVQNLEEDGNIPSILIHQASTRIGLTEFTYLNDQKRLVDLWSLLLRVITSSNEKIEKWTWGSREVIDLINNGINLIEQEKKLWLRKPETIKILAGYRKYILSFLV